VVFQAGLPRGTRAGPARTGAAGGAASHLPRVVLRWRRRSDRGRGGVHPAFVPDGPRPVRPLRGIWRAAVDAECVLRDRRGGHRDHRAQRSEAREDDAREGLASVEPLRDQRRRDRLDRVRDRLVVCRCGSDHAPRPRQARGATRGWVPAARDHLPGRGGRRHCRADRVAAPRKDHALLRRGGRLRLRQRAGRRSVG
jgi:hypothetical protein